MTWTCDACVVPGIAAFRSTALDVYSGCVPEYSEIAWTFLISPILIFISNSLHHSTCPVLQSVDLQSSTLLVPIRCYRNVSQQTCFFPAANCVPSLLHRMYLSWV
jgi:hypothetical protein